MPVIWVHQVPPSSAVWDSCLNLNPRRYPVLGCPKTMSPPLPLVFSQPWLSNLVCYRPVPSLAPLFPHVTVLYLGRFEGDLPPRLLPFRPRPRAPSICALQPPAEDGFQRGRGSLNLIRAVRKLKTRCACLGLEPTRAARPLIAVFGCPGAVRADGSSVLA